jgi:hypothetical protein
MAPPSGGGFFAGRHGVIADAALPRQNMVDPVPTQCMMVDREFPRRPFDRRTGGKKPFDPRAFEVLASPDSVPSENLFLAPSAFPAYVLQKICRVEKGFLPTKIANL